MKSLLLLFTFLISSASQAVQFDKDLLPYLSRTKDQRIIRVILIFKSNLDLKRLPSARINSPVQRRQVQIAMMMNAQRSQAEFVSLLKSWKASGVPNQFVSLWLINGMVLDLPVSALSRLAGISSIEAVHSDRQVRLVAPVEFKVAPPVSFAGSEVFTYGLKRIKVPEFRKAQPSILGRGVRVSVIDTGVDASHPDLVNKVVAFKDFVNNQKLPYDDRGHGTHCSGIIAASSTSGLSFGVAPEVNLIGAKIFGKKTDSDAVSIFLAMQWVIDPDLNPNTNDGAMIASNSWTAGIASADEDPANNPFCKAVASWAQLGIMPLFAAGNDGPQGESVGLPAACPEALAIGATGSSDKVAFFSSRGPAVWKTVKLTKPDVSAPGVLVSSSLPNGKYGLMSGTSMATPHVAGSMALIYQMQPSITVEGLISLMKQSAQKIDNDPNSSGAGRIDVLKASQILVGRGLLLN